MFFYRRDINLVEKKRTKSPSDTEKLNKYEIITIAILTARLQLKHASRYPKVRIRLNHAIAFINLPVLTTFRSVIQKLVFFTGAMVILPVLAFFVTQWLFSNNSIISGGVAALVANVVLIGYIIAAFTEDTSTPEEESKKDI